MNHTNNSYVVISRDFYTIQAVDDVAIYQAKLSSSAGDLITPGTYSTKITLTVHHNFTDITDKFKKIVWKKFTYEGNNLIEEEGWGIDKLGNKEIQVLREEFEKKIRIECLVYSTVDNKETIVASDYITMVNINDLNPSNQPPQNPKEGEVWLDTSTVPPVFKVFINGEWQIVSDMNPIYKDIEALLEAISKIDDEIFNINQELGTNTLLNIDNKTDYLWYYNEHLTSTNGISPKYPNNKAKLYKDGKFDRCVLVNSNIGSALEYDPVLKHTNDFTINMWIKPHETLLVNNADCRLISTCDVMTANLLCLHNASPVITNSSKKRFVAEFGINSSGVRQYKDLVHNDSFSYNKWEMLTITLDIQTKEFKFYRNGDFWTSTIVETVNIPEKFEIKRAGWFIENLTILNGKSLGLTDIKSIYNINKPFKDMLPKIIEAPNPKDITMTIT